MDRWVVAVIAVPLLVVCAAVAVSLKYSQATVLFGLVAFALAPVAIHKERSVSSVLGLLVFLTFFASYPLKKYLCIDENFGLLGEIGVALAYASVLFLVGFGWRRDWHTSQ